MKIAVFLLKFYRKHFNWWIMMFKWMDCKTARQGLRYLQPKPEAEESEESVSEQCSSDEESQPPCSSGPTEDSSKDSSTSSSDRFTPGYDDDDTDDEDVSSEYPSEDEPLERTRSKTKKCGPPVRKTKEVVLDAEGISQISESSYKSATKLQLQRIPKKWAIRKWNL